APYLRPRLRSGENCLVRLLFCGGGTGGHVYAALAVLAALHEQPFSLSRDDVLYLGVRGRADEVLVPQAGYRFTPIPSGAVVGRTPTALAVGLVRNLRGTVQALSLLHGWKTDAVFATGGYVSVPV